MMATKVVNGVRREMTPEEVAALPVAKPRKKREPPTIDVLIEALKVKGTLTAKNLADAKTKLMQ